MVCGMYVDLNQIRAGEAPTPEASTHCSVSFRIRTEAESRAGMPGDCPADHWLAPLTLAADQLAETPSPSGCRASDQGLLPVSLHEYLCLLDWAGRQVCADKRGAIPAEIAPILDRLGIVSEELLETVQEFPRRFPRFAGSVKQFTSRAAQAGRRWLHGVRHAARVFR